MKQAKLFILILTIALIAGCASRYKLDLLMQSDGFDDKLKVNQTHFYPNTQLTDPYLDEKITKGSDNVLVATVSTRWVMQSDQDFIFDENWKSYLFLQLPNPLKNDSLNINDRSFVTLLGYYQLSNDERIFNAESGFLKVDSVTDKNVFVSLNGIYKSKAGRILNINGELKGKVAE